MSSGLWRELLVGFCLMLVMEGVMPFLYPQRWRRMVQQLSLIDNRTLRLFGLLSMLAGVALLYWVN